MPLTILEGSTFCICDETGDLGAETSGLFDDDTRFLSRLSLRVNGALAGGLPKDAVAIARERFPAALEDADRLDPVEIRRAAEERFAPDRMVGDYLEAYRAALDAA